MKTKNFKQPVKNRTFISAYNRIDFLNRSIINIQIEKETFLKYGDFLSSKICDELIEKFRNILFDYEKEGYEIR